MKMYPLEFVRLEIPEIVLVKGGISRDARGLYSKTFLRSDFEEHSIPGVFAEEGFSFSRTGVLRGMHFQFPPHAQGKLVRVMSGRVHDVVVDIRPKSRRFGKFVSVDLEGGLAESLWIPPGFAHGFYAFEDSIVTYRFDCERAVDFEGGFAWNDPDVAIDWPARRPLLSSRDATLPRLNDLRSRLSQADKRPGVNPSQGSQDVS